MLQVDQLPGVLPRFFIVLKMFANPDESGTPQSLTIDLESPTGESESLITNQTVNTTVPSRDPGGEAAATIVIETSMQITVPGKHVFHFQINGAEVGRLPLYIQLTPPAQDEVQ